jgi:pyrimidine-nucleoside phosphorylase
MNFVEIIRKKRNGEILSAEEIDFSVSSYTRNQIPDYQFSAFLMALFIRGMNKKETDELTKSMLYSGKVLDLKEVPGIKVDKHSTGGVGDKTSLIIAPIAAAAGIIVPMISGRGLGHTGGTLDKLEAIQGFKTNLSLSEFKKSLKKTGAALIGQTKEIAPADRLIYSLRDVTATVESIPLITASIMSKKLAEGIDGLVLDIKTGSGAFMKQQKEAEELAKSLINTAKNFNKKVIGFITDMNQPLGNYIGNWLEVVEAVKILRGEIKSDLYKLSVKLAGAMIFMGQKASSLKEGEQKAAELISNGKAFNKFIDIVKQQGGDTFYLNNPDKYPVSKIRDTVRSEKSGYIKSIHNFEIGMCALELGAGRKTKEDTIDPKAGIIFKVKIGDYVKKNDVIAELFSDKEKVFNSVKRNILNSIYFSGKKIKKTKLIKKIL